MASPLQHMVAFVPQHCGVNTGAAAARRCATASAWSRTVAATGAAPPGRGVPRAPRSGSGRLGATAVGAGAAAATALGRIGTSRRPASSVVSGVAAAQTSTIELDDEQLLAELAESARALGVLQQAWNALPAGNGGRNPDLLPRLLASETKIRESMKACSVGDPSETTTIPRHQCRDPVAVAHGEVTRAHIEADLAKAQWEIRSAQAEGAGSWVSAMINSAVLRMRLFDIDGAYEELQQIATAGGGSTDPRFGLLTRYCAQLKAPRHADFLTGEDLTESHARSLMRHIRSVLLENKYQTDMIVTATKAGSMSDFIFVESRADQLEMGLLDNIEESNPMKPETNKPDVPSNLVDIIRIFLLHRVLPLARLGELFGAECVKFLLKLQAISAIDGDACRLVPVPEAVLAVEADNVGYGAFFVMANMTIWPCEEDLLLATDFEQTFSSEGLEPVMYLSEDSLALVCGAPREKASSVLDICCGSGVQGIVALRHYADRATFIDLNPRAIRFTSFNLALNGMSERVDGLHLGNLYTTLQGTPKFDAIVANPPFVPNPQGIASGAGAMFGNGGDFGEDVFAGIVRGTSRLLGPGGRLSVVAMTPNVEDLPGRLKSWYCEEADEGANFQALIFRGLPTPAQQYLPTSSSVETYRYQAAMQRMGVRTLSEVVTVLTVHGPGSSAGPNVGLAGNPRANLWSDHSFLRLVVQRSLFTMINAPVETAQPKTGQQPGDSASSSSSSSGMTNGIRESVAATSDASLTQVNRSKVVAADVPPKQVPVEQPATQRAAKADDRSREGSLPGFQVGFFPAYCQEPLAGWEATAEELEQIQHRSPVLQR
mmetsp:Transcript_134756/g.262426  ORF Transcript_134756/g.262426 Transcript_134756/m.262426 type:complete len:830 (-) Transcript_134756:240-2729(-)